MDGILDSGMRREVNGNPLFKGQGSDASIG